VGDGNPNPANQTCQTNDGRNATRFLPVFPASCPLSVVLIYYFTNVFDKRHLLSVTAVGGTTLIPEVGVELSGGGSVTMYFGLVLYMDSQSLISRKFSRPKYQSTSVRAFWGGCLKDYMKDSTSVSTLYCTSQ